MAGESARLSEAKRRLLEQYLQGDGGRSSPETGAIPPRPSGTASPLSFGQQQMWLHAQLAPGMPLYNEAITVYRKGPLDVSALERGFNEIVRRHEAWRTTFKIVDGRMVQVVSPPPMIPLLATFGGRAGGGSPALGHGGRSATLRPRSGPTPEGETRQAGR